MERRDSALPIKVWAEEDRPREKLIQFGRKALTEAELMAILIGTGSQNESAVELAKRLLCSVGNNLHELSKLGLSELNRFKGIADAKAIRIMAAFELGRRRNESGIVKRERIVTSMDANALIRHLLIDLPHEEFWVIYLNRSNAVIKKEMISRGGISGTVVDSRLIFKAAIESLASSIILCHNHPSGNRRPSEQDIQITKKIKAAGQLLEIPVLDHVIICEESYYSFADEGIL